MKLLLLSDNHGSENIFDIMNSEDFDKVFHLGDSEFDMETNIMKMIDYSLKGNCDLSNYKNEIEVTIENYNVFATHGHRYNVKNSLDVLSKVKGESDIIIYGHTHIPYIALFNNTLFLNPGSTVLPRGDYPPSYMLVELLGKKIICQLKSSVDNSILKEEIVNYE